jgi:hypothetical protein
MCGQVTASYNFTFYQHEVLGGELEGVLLSMHLYFRGMVALSLANYIISKQSRAKSWDPCEFLFHAAMNCVFMNISGHFKHFLQ